MPTAEQAAVIEDARERPGESRKVESAAGSGKTTLLEMLARDRPDPVVYVAFSRPIKLAAEQRFPAHARVTTAHGAAYGAMRMQSQRTRLEARLFGDRVGSIVRLPRCRLPEDVLGQVVLETVSRFCHSADAELAPSHVAVDPDEPEDIGIAALDGARQLWERMADRDDDCPITHDTYLKLWQLGEPRIRGVDWALFDEAQDASPVMLDIMMRQPFPVTWVGDDAQSIYAFRGAVNAMRRIQAPSFPLSQSFRFGQPVADIANAILACKPDGRRPTWRISGNPARETQVGTFPRGLRHAFLARTNSEWFQHGLQFRGRVHVIGGLEEAARLLDGAWRLWRNGERPARVPAIARFASWRQLCEHAERFDDRELKFARRIVEQFRESLPQAIAGFRARHTEHEDDAELILSTAHKAKGHQFPYVRLGDGFASPADGGWDKLPAEEREAELNLLYVAATRAQSGLEPGQAVADCIAFAREQAAPGETLPHLKLSQIRVRVPPKALVAAARPPMAAPVPVPSQPEPWPTASGPCRRAWTADEDVQAFAMASRGLAAGDIAEWLGRSPAAVAVRLALLRAPGSDTAMLAEVLTALAPPAVAAMRKPLPVTARRPPPRPAPSRAGNGDSGEDPRPAVRR
jgi:hypothetical protein